MINQVTLVGRITKNPELRITPEGIAVTSITLALNRQFRSQQGEYGVDFVQCTIWKKAAENTVNYCRKGSLIGITGRIQTRNYDNQDGRKIYVTEVVADTVKFIGTKRSEDSIHHLEKEKPEPVSIGQG